MNFLITGGASGLGYAITKAISGNYADAGIWFTFHSSIEAAKELEAGGANLHGIKCDFRNENEVAALCKFIEVTEIDVLINNALTKLDKQYFHKTPSAQFTDSFKTDVLPTLAITQAFILKARKRKSGKIITILTSGLQGTPPIGWSVYLANKSYLQSMHRSWAAENKAFNIFSNTVSPDFMRTALHKDMDERMIETIIEKHPLKKLLTVEEVAQAILNLCDPSSIINGKDISFNPTINP